MAGIFINFGAGIITPITFEMTLSTNNFTVGVDSAAISASRIIISFCICSLVTMLFPFDMATLAWMILLIYLVSALAFWAMKSGCKWSVRYRSITKDIFRLSH